jgi:hypothetical protein
MWNGLRRLGTVPWGGVQGGALGCVVAWLAALVLLTMLPRMDPASLLQLAALVGCTTAGLVAGCRRE